MLRRIPRILRLTVIVAVVLAVSATVYQSWSAGSPGAGGWTQTQFGPLGPADRDLLVKVRLAGLWEGPTGQQAEQQASSPEVQQVGKNISVEHAQLDQEVRNVADQLGVLLPSSPNAQQVAWMDEISAQTGSDYDRVFVQLLREAHGTVLPLIASVRSGTRNDLVRQFAVTADAFVSRHHEYLESTGLVDYAALPHPGPGLLAGGTDPQDLIVPIAVFVAAVLAAVALVAGLRNRRARPTRVTVPSQRAPAAASPLPALAAVAALPPGPSYLPDSGYGAVVTDSGPHRIITDAGYRNDDNRGAVPHPPYRRTVSDSGPYRSATDTRIHRGVSDSGPHTRFADPGSGSWPAPTNGRRHPDADSGYHRTVTDTGPRRSVSDSGSSRRVEDSGSHRSVSDSGSHRAANRSRPRHSFRR